MAEKKFIDADELRRRVKEKTNPYGKPTLDYESGVKVLNMIDEAPAADVVEVVRCKDCNSYNGHGFCLYHAEIVNDDDYCPCGERKEKT